MAASIFRKPGAIRAPLMVAALLATLAACGHDRGRAQERDPALYSPNGEPLSGGPLGKVTCEAGVSLWFDRTDRNHDGFIDGEEFEADALRFFAVMDTDKDGYVTPPELAALRAPYRVEPIPRSRTEDAEPRSRDRGNRPQREDQARGDGDSLGANFPDPVMAADTNLDQRVSLTEFRDHAKRKFAELDLNHDGRLSRDEVQRLCKSR